MGLKHNSSKKLTGQGSERSCGMDISMEKAKSLLEKCIAETQGLIQDPSKVDDLLKQLEDKLREVPRIGQTLSDLPLMISMVKGYITREYSEVSPKVIGVLLGAFLYLVRKKDVIPDNVPIVGIADDLAVLGLALKLCEPELQAFKEFRDGKKPEEANAEEDTIPEELPESLAVEDEEAEEETMIPEKLPEEETEIPDGE